jgi:hypothetical protein
VAWLELIEEYPYFFANALGTLLSLGVGALTLSRAQLRLSVLSGLLSAPCFLFMPLLERHYWQPRRFGGRSLGAEDVLCSFMVAAMAWAVVAVVLRGRLSDRIVRSGLPRRYNLTCGVSICLFVAGLAAGLSAMSALIGACAVMAAVLLWANRRAWPLAVVGTCGFGAAWFAAVRLFFWLWPEFAHQWNPGSAWSAPVLGVPLGELTWAIVFGAYWPLFVAYVLRIEFVSSRPVTT